ncbi:hypothetical protein [Mycobacterium sp. 852002-51057_SCH5723018]|uniref:hypothetical protein n=1 Tax=Mycobacterium sp. 852002-51057_SCH5723018 TaxID=1834094 RepID=UPI000A650039|nr:hypothetical protein [Mycobacterium sp. 852002-51057_SCH5723018]
MRRDTLTDMHDQDIEELINHYNRWRQIFRYANQSVPNEPIWENGRLYFREGYPNPGWSALILEFSSDGHYAVLHASTERRNTPLESTRAVFSQVQDAGKYIMYEVADLLRVSIGLKPLERQWRDAGLDASVRKVTLSDKQAKYELVTDPTVYFIAYSGGIQPFNHILPLSYDQLDSQLLEGFPSRVTAQLAGSG